MKSVKASAPGNIFFAGEHAVVYGVPAIITAVGKRTYVIATERKDNCIELHSDVFSSTEGKLNTGSGEAEVIEFPYPTDPLDDTEVDYQLPDAVLKVIPLWEMLSACIKKFGIKKGFEIQIKSEIMTGSGMSSSTAVLCAMLQALDGLFGFNFSKAGYFDFLIHFQTQIHGGRASGAELISSTFGGSHSVQKIGNTLEKDTLGNVEFDVVIGNTKIKSETWKVVEYVKNRKEKESQFVNQLFKEIEETVRSMEESIKAGNKVQVGILMNRNHVLLKQLGVSHSLLDDAVKTARKNMALGAKLSGGGWGGIMFAMVQNKDSEVVTKALNELGLETTLTKIGVHGVKLE